MYSILLTVKRPDPQKHDLADQYDRFVRRLEGIAKPNKDSQVLSEGAILLQLNEGLQDVYDVVGAIPNGLTYTYTILTKDTHWHSAIKTAYPEAVPLET